MEQLKQFADNYLVNLHIPTTIQFTDVLEILILSFLVYQIMVWIKKTKAWALLRGTGLILVFVLLAALLQMNTIIWIAKNVFSLAITAMIVILQPELRRALEELGKKSFVRSLVPIDVSRNETGLFSDETVAEITKASLDMSKVRTGALIVVAQSDSLEEYEKTGIVVDGIVTSQLLVNIFEHNTPLHDGAVIIKGNRVTSATCYLPLSDSTKLSKELGTRHRAGLGISEATDSLTIIVSEETGKISVAYKGELTRNVSKDELEIMLEKIQNKQVDERKIRLWKGRAKNEKKADS